MKSFKVMLKLVRKLIRDFELTIDRCEELMREGFDPIDFEDLRITLANLRGIEWLLKDICKTEKRERKRSRR
jgi:hypothetical protein